MFCTSCGTRLSANARFCTACGAATMVPEQIDQPNQPQAVPSPTAASELPAAALYAQHANSAPEAPRPPFPAAAPAAQPVPPSAPAVGPVTAGFNNIPVQNAASPDPASVYPAPPNDGSTYGPPPNPAPAPEAGASTPSFNEAVSQLVSASRQGFANTSPVARRLIVAAVGAVVAACLLWMVLGARSLLADLALAVAGATWAIGGLAFDRWRPDRMSLATTIGQLPEARRKIQASSQTWLIVIVAIAPIFGGMVAATIAGLHHSSNEDVCAAYDAYALEAAKSDSTFGFGSDNAWFRAVGKVGAVASDYGGDDTEKEAIRSAGRKLVEIGDSSYANVSNTETAMSPIEALCLVGD